MAEESEQTEPADFPPDGVSDARRFDHLPAEIRRQQRFAGADAAALAEAVALRREIDQLAARFSRWQAQYRDGAADVMGAAGETAPVTWLHLRRAGLAMLAEIERQRSMAAAPSTSAPSLATPSPATPLRSAPATTEQEARPRVLQPSRRP